MMVRAEYAHLKAEEKAIMIRFVAREMLPGSYEYDIHLSVPDPAWPPDMSEEDKTMWRRRTAKRIDVICKTSSECWILEVTPKLGKAVVGGILMYKYMYEDQYSPMLPVRLGIIVAMDDPSYHPLLEREHIKLWVV